jgi:hypothetical protein
VARTIRHAVLVWIVSLISTIGLSARADPDAANAAPSAAAIPATMTLPAKVLRGYGELSAVFHSMKTADGTASLTRITCQSPQKALLVQAKYLSDVGLLPGSEADTLAVGARSIPVRRAPAGGALACCAAGREVLILAAPSPKALANLIDRHVPLSIEADAFAPHAQVPMYLDRFDKYGLLVYYGPWTTPPHEENYDYRVDFKFARDNKFGLILWQTPLPDDTAEGMNNEKAWDWIQEECRSLHVPLHLNLSFSWPMLWLGNRYREETMLKAPQFVGGFYGVAHDSCGVGAVSWHSDKAKAATLGVLQETVRRYVNAPNVVGWLEPHSETADNPQGLLIDYGPIADRSLQQYMKQRCGRLSNIGRRWYGDPAHYHCWEEIRAPELAQFVGFGPEAIDLRGVWRVKYIPAPDGHLYTREQSRRLGGEVIPTAPVPPQWYQPGFDDSAWDELLAPGNDRSIEMTWSPMLYRRTIDVPAAWLAAHKKAWLYFWVIFGRDFDPHQVYVNGRQMKSDPNLKIAFDVSAALKPGPNSIVLQPHRGIMCYRSYLSPEAPAQYPNLGKQKNARWVDFRKWLMWSRARQIVRGMEMIRQIDPDRPINLMAPDDNAGAIKQVGERFGAFFHNTGYAAGFWAEYNPLLMRGSGLPATAEPGNGAPNVGDFMAFWGRWLSEGLNGVHYFQHLGEITWNAEVLKQFQANRTMYEMIGKYHVPAAKVAILFGAGNEQISGYPWTQNPAQFQPGGYWRVNPAMSLLNYCARDAVSEEDFGTDNVDKYRVIIDSNTSITSEELLANIEKWVRGGGVFVTYGQTGRHAETEPDTWPIRRLSGYNVTALADWGAGKQFQRSPTQTIYKNDAWTKPTRAAGIQLSRAAAECQDLLVWSDGTVAAGLRPLGAGWVVTLGPAVGGDDVGKLLAPIIEHFDAANLVPAHATLPGLNLYTRHYISNTGLYDVWVMYNETGKPITTDLVFLPGFRPASFVDVVTGQSLEIARDVAGDRVRNIMLGNFETRMWISPRQETASSSLEWLSVQRDWWAGAATPDRKPLPTPAENQRFTVDLTKDWTFKPADGLTDEQTAALTQGAVDDSTWEKRDLGIWSLPDHPSVKHAVMRRKFAVPSGWTSGYVGLCVAQWAGVFVEGGRIFIDGQALRPAFYRDGIYLDPAKGLLKPGTSHVLALDVKSKQFVAGPRGNAWIYYIPEPQQRQSLSGDWRRYANPLQSVGKAQLPGPFQGQYASRNVLIDRAHASQNVLIYVDGMAVQGVMVNGKLINRSTRVYNSIFSINVTPYVNFGQDNLIELVVRPDPQPAPIKVVEIRYYDKDVYP